MEGQNLLDFLDKVSQTKQKADEADELLRGVFNYPNRDRTRDGLIRDANKLMKEVAALWS